MRWSSSRSADDEWASAKIVIAGAFGVGKTTAIGAISEVQVVGTEALMTEAAHGTEQPMDAKSLTTVAMDFGRRALDPDLTLYLFGTPGHPRFWFLWDDLVRGTLGAVVLVDTRDLAASFPSISYFESRGDIPYVVVVNRFNGRLHHDLPEIRGALRLPPDVPLLHADVREAREMREVLRALVKHALNLLDEPSPAGHARHAAAPTNHHIPVMHPTREASP
jgi:signal recognition particle receptor subunit beta